MAPHPQLLIIPPPPSNSPSALSSAAGADLREIMGEFDLRVESKAASVEQLAALLASDAPSLVIMGDILNPTVSLIDGMLAALEEFDFAVGPAFDGSLYALGHAGTRPLPQAAASELAKTLFSGKPCLARVVSVLSVNGAAFYGHAPWYRASDEAQRHFAMEHMELMRQSDDPDFAALRTLKALADKGG